MNTESCPDRGGVARNAPPPLSLRQAHAVLDADGAIPEWAHLIPAGTFSGRDGRGPYYADADRIRAEFEKWGGEIVIDYEHPDDWMRSGQPVPAAGWVKALEARGDGIWGRVEWTDRAAALIRAREYRYLSPVFDYYVEDGRVIRLRSAGLTNQPNLMLTAFNRQQFCNATVETSAMNELEQRVQRLLGAPEAVTTAELVAALDSVLQAPELNTARASLSLPAASPVDVLVAAARKLAPGAAPEASEAARLKGELATALQRIASLESEHRTAAIDKLLEAAVAAHKLAPAEEPVFRRLAELDFAAAKKELDARGPNPLFSASHRAAASAPAARETNPLLADADRRAGRDK